MKKYYDSINFEIIEKLGDGNAYYENPHTYYGDLKIEIISKYFPDNDFKGDYKKQNDIFWLMILLWDNFVGLKHNSFSIKKQIALTNLKYSNEINKNLMEQIKILEHEIK